jgi:hypothetical protein
MSSSTSFSLGYCLCLPLCLSELDPTHQIDRLFTTDHKAINHILMNDFDYQKPEPARWQLGRILGYGVLVVEGEKHKKQVVTSLEP